MNYHYILQDNYLNDQSHYNYFQYRYMWSDTGSSALNSVGDTRKYHNPEKKFSVGPETSPTRWSSKDYPVKEESSYSWKNGF
jgi:hypothetical protein